MHYFLLPYIEQDALFRAAWISPNDGSGGSGSQSWRTKSNAAGRRMKIYLAPNDPSVTADGIAWDRGGAASYHSNWHAFGGGWDEDWQVGGKARISGSFPDGTSNTIAFLERYAICGPGPQWDNSTVYAERTWQEDGSLPGPITQYHRPQSCFTSPTYWLPRGLSASVGGSGFQNYSALGNANPRYPAVTDVQLPQTKPAVRDCLPSRLQSFGSGIQVLLMDGSVRSVSTSMSATSWYTALLPNDGLPMGNDW
jgi:hypothetical protein